MTEIIFKINDGRYDENNDYVNRKKALIAVWIVYCFILTFFGVTLQYHNGGVIVLMLIIVTAYMCFWMIVVFGIFNYATFFIIRSVHLAIASIPFINEASNIYAHYNSIKHPLEPYVKSGETPPESVLTEISALTGDVGDGKSKPAYVYENYRIKTEELMCKIEKREAEEKAREQAKIARKKQREENRRQDEALRKQKQHEEEVKRKINEDIKKHGTHEQQDRRTALNQSQAELARRFAKLQRDKK